MNSYLAFYNGQKRTVYAPSLYDAKLQAVDYFKPPKSKQHMVSVMLCEIDGKPVTHKTSDI